MVKILIGLFAAILVAAGAFFGFEFYVQQRAATEVEAAFAQVRAAGNKATHGKVSFDLFSRTITVADIAGESAAQPPVSVKIGRFTAAGVSQPDASRFTAGTIDAENVEVVGTMAAQAGWRASYKAPKISVVGYAGPAGPLRQVDPASPTDIYRFVLEHFAAVTAATVTIPTLATAVSLGGGTSSGTGDYTYSGIVLRDIKDGRIATTAIEKMAFAANMGVAGKTEKINGEIAGFTTSDFDAAGAAVILDPARANDDKYYRIYRQATVGPYTMTSEKGLRVRIDGMTIDDIGVRPSRLQLPALIALIQQLPAAGTTPTPAQTRDLLEKIAGIYEGLRIGNAEMRGLAFDMPDAPFRLAAVRFNLENGKIGEFAVEGLDARSPKGPVKVGRFALKSLDVANLLRMSSQFSNPGQKPSPDQLLGLLMLLEGTEIKGVVAPYKDSDKPVNIDTLNLVWGQFVGPIPSRARLTVKMTGPIDASDPDPFRMLVTAGKDQAAINLDLGATWTEGSRTFMLAPVTAEIGEVGTAAARISLANVPREVFSINPLQAAIMAAQIEAGTVEVALRDIGGVDLAVAQYARNQKVTPDAARRAIVENIKNTGMTMATTNPDAMAIAGAVTRFIENPRGTLTVKLTPKGKVPAMSLIEAIKTNPLAALARFQVEATTGR
jgi:hypothetical protein